MTTEQTQAVAGVYAEALLSLAIERGQEEEVREEMEGIGSVLGQVGQWREFLANPGIVREAKEEMLVRVFGGQVSELTLNFLRVLAAKDRLGVLAEAVRQYGQLLDKQQGKVAVQVTSAVALGSEQRAQMQQRLEAAFGRVVQCEFRQDAAVIGGLVVRVEDRVLDASVRGQLAQVMERLGTQTRGKLNAAGAMEH